MLLIENWCSSSVTDDKHYIDTLAKKLCVPNDFSLILARKMSLMLIILIENSSNHISRLCTHVTFTIFVSAWHLPRGLGRNYHDCCITSSWLRPSWHKVIQGNSLSLAKTFLAFFSCKKLFDIFTITPL